MTNFGHQDPPKGWIKLRPIAGFSDKIFYIRASKIIGVGHPVKAGNEAITAVYTIYEEGNPLLVYGSINEIMEEIEDASQEK